jgi:glycosyltransferase involved in cell wall biosynthesis
VGFDAFEKEAARRLSACVTVNEHMAAQFHTFNPEGAVLYNYPLASQFDFARPGAGGLPQSAAPGPEILYLGSINQERGLGVMLEAMPLVRERFPDAVCTLVGPLDTGGLDAKYLPLEPWLARGGFTLKGKAPYAEVPGYMSRAQLALVPLLPTLNYQKAIPVKLIEYMAAGLPVVGSDFGYIAAIITENRCGLLARPGDPVDLAARICALLADPDEALAAAQRGWDAFHARYCWEREEEKLGRLYARLLGQ